MDATQTKSRPAARAGSESGPHLCHVVREWGESLGIALVLALILRHFVVEAFKIPTKSMEPTLVGHKASGDKILVSKFAYDFARPQRGDVIVFKYPEDPYKNYIKRLIGLPGDKIMIWAGDVYVGDNIWRKPKSVQRALWMPASHEGLLWDEVADAAIRDPSGSGEIPNHSLPPLIDQIQKWQDQNRASRKELVMKRRLKVWRPTDESEWSSFDNGGNAKHRGLGAQPGPSGDKDSMVYYYERKVRDRVLTASGKLWLYIKEGIDRRECMERVDDSNVLRRDTRPLYAVDDLCVRFNVVPENPQGEVVAYLEDSRRSFETRIPVGKAAALSVQITAKGEKEPETISGPSFTLRAGRSTRIAFQNVDDTVVLEIDGERLIVHEYPGSQSPRRVPTVRTDVGFGVRGVPAKFTDIRIERDIYYLARLREAPGVSQSWEMGDGQYFVLGDNSPNSKDSRLWDTGHTVPQENLIGEAFAVFWPPKRWRIIR